MSLDRGRVIEHLEKKNTHYKYFRTTITTNTVSDPD